MRTLLMLALLLLIPTAVHAGKWDVELGIDRLANESDTAYWDRLFIQCGTWLPQYDTTKDAAQAKLIELGVPALEHLVPTWLGSRDVRHRVTMEAIIAGIGVDGLPTMLPYLNDPLPDMRQRIAWNASRLESDLVLPALVERLAIEEDPMVLTSILEGVGLRGVGQPDLVRPVARLAHHTDERVRRNVAVALGRIGDATSGGGEAVMILSDLAADPLFSVRFPALEALFALPPEPVRAWLSTGWTLHSDEHSAWMLAVGLSTAPDLAVAQDSLSRFAIKGADALVSRIAKRRGLYRLWLRDHAIGDALLAGLAPPADLQEAAVATEIEHAMAAQLEREAAEAVGG